MSWLKLDDDFPNHPKILILDDAAFRLHITALCYCARTGTEGFVSVKAIPRLGPVALAPQLVEARLWEPCEGGWMIHDYLDYNLSNARVAEIRALRAEAGRRGGLAPAKQIANPVSRIPLTRSQNPVSAEQVAKQVASNVEDANEGSIAPSIGNDGSLELRASKANLICARCGGVILGASIKTGAGPYHSGRCPVEATA